MRYGVNFLLFPRTLIEFMEPFNKSTDAFIKKLKEKADGKTEIRMLQHFGRCVLDVIAKVKNKEANK